MPNRPKVLLLIPHLGGGGAERVFELLARNLTADKYDLHLALASSPHGHPGDLPATLTVHPLAARRVRYGAIALVRLVRQIRPNLILTTMAHLNFMVLLLRPLFPRKTRILVRQNGTVSAMLADLRSPALTRLLYRTLYPRADGIVCQSAPMAEDLCLATGIPPKRLMVAPNPIDIAPERAQFAPDADACSGGGPYLLAVGRLVPQKGFDLLLDALATLRQSFPTADLAIAGTGPEESSLKQQCAALGLESAVRFLGYVPEPVAYYPWATLLVSSSRQEGIPNALLEAAGGGLPIVATPSSGGIVELLRQQPGAWLADAISADSLAAALAAALVSLSPGERFEHTWLRPFRLENAIASYESLIDQTLAVAAAHGEAVA